MQHIGIDLGGKESQVCIRSEDGKIVQETRVATRKLASFFKRQPPSRIVLETCAEAFRVADLALECGHEVRVVPATLVRSLGVGARGIKNDLPVTATGRGSHNGCPEAVSAKPTFQALQLRLT